ncbi:MAG: DUF4292 domain-containing protein [Ignavibacteriae bacterium]|nr:DUF4292 domain-containing protein [Ignavibacteriota bacterium]
MKRIIYSILILIIFFLTPSVLKSAPSDSLMTLITTTVKTLNDRATPIDKIHSEASINIKTKNMDQDGFIEIKLQRPDDFWFRIWGKFAFISKDAFFAHFNRKKFIYFNNLEDKVIEGPTTDKNIGHIIRVECSFDDMMNALSGAPTINLTKKDTISWSSDANYYILTLKSGKIKRYWIKKSDNSLEKYAYLARKTMNAYLLFEFSNYTISGSGYYAKNIKITKGTTKLTYNFKNVSLNNSSLNFTVTYPSGTKKIKW